MLDQERVRVVSQRDDRRTSFDIHRRRRCVRLEVEFRTARSILDLNLANRATGGDSTRLQHDIARVSLGRAVASTYARGQRDASTITGACASTASGHYHRSTGASRTGTSRDRSITTPSARTGTTCDRCGATRTARTVTTCGRRNAARTARARTSRQRHGSTGASSVSCTSCPRQCAANTRGDSSPSRQRDQATISLSAACRRLTVDQESCPCPSAAGCSGGSLQREFIVVSQIDPVHQDLQHHAIVGVLQTNVVRDICRLNRLVRLCRAADQNPGAAVDVGKEHEASYIARN